MTAQDALEILTNVIQSSEMTKATDTVCAIAQKAIEKQIPKKPYYKEKAFFNFDGYCCPNCNTFIKSKNEWHVKPTFCKNCGQALDWSDIK